MKNGLRINLTSNPFLGKDSSFQIEFPENWKVKVLHMEGATEKPEDTRSIIERAIKGPAGPRLSDICKGKRSAVILFDDITRGTRVHEAVPFILEELKSGGIKDIRFIAALGAHAPHSLKQHAMKLGRDVVESFPVYNHNPFSLCDYVGKTRNGVKLKLNTEYLSCEVKIGIGAIVPHSFTGFGGGGKIILPGISHISSIEENHRMLLSEKYPKESWGMGTISRNPFLEDIEEALSLSGLDFKVDFIVNYGGETVDAVAGNPSKAFRMGIKKALTHYRTRVKGKADIVIANSSFKVNEAAVSLDQAASIVKEDGDVVIIANTEEGQVTHYLFGPFGTRCGGSMWMKREALPKQVGRLIIQSPMKDIPSECYFGPVSSWTHTWEETMELLMERWKGTSPEVFVLPDATVQLIEKTEAGT